MVDKVKFTIEVTPMELDDFLGSTDNAYSYSNSYGPCVGEADENVVYTALKKELLKYYASR